MEMFLLKTKHINSELGKILFGVQFPKSTNNRDRTKCLTSYNDFFFMNGYEGRGEQVKCQTPYSLLSFFKGNRLNRWPKQVIESLPCYPPWVAKDGIVMGRGSMSKGHISYATYLLVPVPLKLICSRVHHYKHLLLADSGALSFLMEFVLE